MSKYSLVTPVSNIYHKIGLPRNNHGVRFLCYHGVVRDIEELHPLRRSVSIGLSEFNRHLEHFKKENYRVITMKNALEILSSENNKKGEKYICLTFDDGYKDNFTEAWPALKSFGYSAHFFIVSDFIGKSLTESINGKHYTRDYLTNNQVKSFIKEGGSVGSHGMDHQILPDLAYPLMLKQAASSKKKLESLTGAMINTFAYPSGTYDFKSVKALREAGYDFAFNIGFGFKRRVSGVNRFLIRRNAILSNHPIENMLVISGGFDWLRTYSAVKERLCLRYRK